jgi:DNA-binding PadR family transcriptional regulator
MKVPPTARSEREAETPLDPILLTEPGYLILLSLMPQPAHGYRIMQIINDMFRTGFKMGPGTLYRTLQRLTTEALIDEIETPQGEEADVDRRRAYRLTAKGVAAARAETQRLETLVRLAKVQLPP